MVAENKQWSFSSLVILHLSLDEKIKIWNTNASIHPSSLPFYSFYSYLCTVQSLINASETTDEDTLNKRNVLNGISGYIACGCCAQQKCSAHMLISAMDEWLLKLMRFKIKQLLFVRSLAKY